MRLRLAQQIRHHCGQRLTLVRRERAGAKAQPETPELMRRHAIVLQPHDEGRARVVTERRFEFKHRLMRLAIARMDAPVRVRAAINGIADDIAPVAVVRRRASKFHPHRARRFPAARLGVNAKLRKVKISRRVIAPRPFARQPLIRQRLQAQSANVLRLRLHGHDERVLFRPRAAHIPRAIGLPRKARLRARRARHAHHVERQPSLAALGLPVSDGRHFLLHLRGIERGQQRRIPPGDGCFSRQQIPPSHMRRHIRIVRPVRAVHPREDRLQRVVIPLRDGVELMIVAAGAVNGETLESAHHRRHHVIAVEHLREPMVEGIFAHPHHQRLIPRPGGEKTQRHRGLRVRGKQRIACHLLLHKTGVRLVLVESANHIVAIRPRIRPGVVVVIAMRVRIVRHIQPMPRPMFAVARRGQQAVDKFFIGLMGPIRRMGLMGESIHLLRRRRQPGEVVAHPANERPSISRQ